ncbi:MAG: FHA domain-containing protein [Phycisphaerales bacterium]|nr:FHA domain-containing protein [Phycisphaerales bacterium]
MNPVCRCAESRRIGGGSYAEPRPLRSHDFHLSSQEPSRSGSAMHSAPPLFVTLLGGSGFTVRLDPVDTTSPLTVGRSTALGEAPTVALKDKTVSGVHLELAVRDGRWHARSVGKAGTLLDGSFMPPRQWTLLGHGATIGISSFRLRLGIGAESVPHLPSTEVADGPAAQRPQAVGRQRLESAHVRLAALLSAARRIATCADETAVAEAVVDILCESGDFDRAALLRHVREHDRDTWQPVALWASDERIRRLPISRTVLSEALCIKGTVRLDVSADWRGPDRPESVLESGATSIVCTPLPRGEAPSAFLYVDTRAEGHIVDSAIPFVDMVAQLAALAEDQLVRLKYEQDMQHAREIQQGSFPAQLPEVDGYEMAARSTPAEKCGGDALDCIGLDDRGVVTRGSRASRVMFLIGDVSGHGVPAALTSMQACGMTRMGARLGHSLTEIMRELDAQLQEDLPIGTYMTAWCGLLEPATHTVEALSAGQGGIFVYRYATEEFEDIATPAAWLGPKPPIDDEIPQPTRTALQRGDMLMMFTDGYWESRSAAGAEWGKRAMKDIVRALRDRPCEEIIDALDRGALEFSGTPATKDDRTAILVRRLR